MDKSSRSPTPFYFAFFYILLSRVTEIATTSYILYLILQLPQLCILSDNSILGRCVAPCNISIQFIMKIFTHIHNKGDKTGNARFSSIYTALINFENSLF